MPFPLLKTPPFQANQVSLKSSEVTEMEYQQQGSSFSVSIKFPDGTSMAVQNDFSKLAYNQKDKLKDFLISILKKDLGLETII